ncbi:MAG: hypothetical protein CSA97_05680 [Bacteroidetes bacterium]|nr:MAG: hypothetical protein CSA97_05680 [Bacteroidota bacterium]
MGMDTSKLRELPIGIETFEEIINDDYVYVDKTDLVWHLAHRRKVMFFGRPRRFGKSLLLSTLAAYFRGERELFRGLKLERLQAESGKEWVEYPVLHLKVAAGDGKSGSDFVAMTRLELDRLDDQYGVDTSAFEHGARLGSLITELAKKFGRKVVILVDEYDAPLIDTLGIEHLREEHEDCRRQLRSLYQNFKWYDQYIHYVLLTGVAQFSGLSLFSGLNNIERISLEEEFSGICGITQEELERDLSGHIDRVAEVRGESRAEVLDQLRRMYDGYKFTPEGERVYNPFGLLSALKSGRFLNHWMRTGTSQVLDSLLPKFRLDLVKLEGGVMADVDDLDQLEGRDGSSAPFLFQTGYLTIVDTIGRRRVVLAFPNGEVKNALAKLMQTKILGYDSEGVFATLRRLKDALNGGDVAGFMGIMEPILAGVAAGNDPKESLIRESHFRNTLFVVFKLLEEEVAIEIPSALGRSDCEVEARDAIYIFELKLRSEGKGNLTPLDALRQIRGRRYGARHRDEGKPMVCVGAVFDNEGGCEWEAMGYDEVMKLGGDDCYPVGG